MSAWSNRGLSACANFSADSAQNIFSNGAKLFSIPTEQIQPSPVIRSVQSTLEELETNNMKHKILIAIAAFGLSIASAKTYHVKLYQPTNVGGTELKAGEYKMDIAGDKVTLTNGKQTGEAHAKVEQNERKYDTNSVRYAGGNRISEIHVGGTNMKLVISE
jgi:hypothetical protein